MRGSGSGSAGGGLRVCGVCARTAVEVIRVMVRVRVGVRVRLRVKSRVRG